MSHKIRRDKRTEIFRPSPSGAISPREALEVVGDGVKIHLDALPEPTRSYEADFAWLQLRHGAVSFFFGKQELDEPGTLRSRLEIKYPPEAFIRQFWYNSRNFHAKLRDLDLPVLLNDRQARISAAPQGMKATADHAERANFEYMCRVGSEGVIDFYYMIPVGIARLAGGFGRERLHLAPVVRIQLTVGEMLYLLDTAEPMVEQLKTAIPEDMWKPVPVPTESRP